MGWYDNYRALEEFGSRDKIPADRMLRLNRNNPNTPAAAWDIAEKKWKEELQKRAVKELSEHPDLNKLMGSAVDFPPTPYRPKPFGVQE